MLIFVNHITFALQPTTNMYTQPNAVNSVTLVDWVQNICIYFVTC